MTTEPLQPEDSRVLGDTVVQTTSLESNAGAVNYHGWLTDLAVPYLGDDPVELGSGLGQYVKLWLEAGAPRFTATDLDPGRLATLEKALGSDPRVTVTALDACDPPEGRHSACVAFNVLEHIPDDLAVLRGMHRLVRPGGYVVMFVPAFMFAMSDFDRTIGHVRRYTKRGLVARYEEAGLRVVTAKYVNIPGILAWYVGMRLLRMTPGDGVLLRVWDKLVIPATRALERHVTAPFGQSVLVVGQVPG